MKNKTLLICSVAVLLAGCEMAGMPHISGVLPGGVNTEHIAMATKSVSAVASASRPISDSEEYYIGRAVAARILSTYPIYRDKKLTEYVNMVGQTVALNSERPNTFAGYHFALLDTTEINAFACPGGTILVTRGMIQAVHSEDQLAAVLAHEVAHINHKDGIAAISSSRWTEALTVIGTQAAKTYGPRDVARLASIFEGSIDDVFKTLVVNGYGQSQESAADMSSLQYLVKTGYDPRALQSFLEQLAMTGKGSQGGILKTHPGTDDRLDAVRGAMPGTAADAAMEKIRTDRFARMNH